MMAVEVACRCSGENGANGERNLWPISAAALLGSAATQIASDSLAPREIVAASLLLNRQRRCYLLAADPTLLADHKMTL